MATPQPNVSKNGAAKAPPPIQTSAPAGAPMWGGDYTEGGFTLPPPDIYRVVIVKADLSENGRQLTLEVHGQGDAAHPDFEDQKLTLIFQNLLAGTPEKQLKLNGLLKRFYADGFGVQWPKDRKPLNPRAFIGKSAWCKFEHETYTRKKDGKGGKAGTEATKLALVAVAKTKAELE